MWCGFWFRGIIEPFFFENEQGVTATANDDRYRIMFNEFLFTKIEDDWFQRDVATCKTAGATLDVIRPVFEDRIISRKVDVVWPPRGCNSIPLDYYLWGAIKDKCYADKPKTIDTSKDNICEAIVEI